MEIGSSRPYTWLEAAAPLALNAGYVLIAVHWVGSGENGAHEVLCDEELGAALAMTDPGAREQYTAAHALKRWILAACTGRSAPELRFERDGWGRPRLSTSAETSQLRFSLSHSDGLVSCAVTRGVDVGVDVERYDRRIPFDVARRFLPWTDVAELERLPVYWRERRLLRAWTRHEALAKARGGGLSLARQVTRERAWRRDIQGALPLVRCLDLGSHALAVASEACARGVFVVRCET